MQKVLDIIRHDVAADKVQIDNPTQNLESYFLEVVRKARESQAETSGSTSGSRVAAYLRGEAESPPAGDRLLERLTVSSTPKPEEPAPSVALAPRRLTKPNWPRWPSRRRRRHRRSRRRHRQPRPI